MNTSVQEAPQSVAIAATPEVYIPTDGLEGLDELSLSSLASGIARSMQYRNDETATLDAARDLDAQAEAEPGNQYESLTRVYDMLSDPWHVKYVKADGVNRSTMTSVGGAHETAKLSVALQTRLDTENENEAAFNAAIDQATKAEAARLTKADRAARPARAINRVREGISARYFEQDYAATWRAQHPGQAYDRQVQLRSPNYQRALIASRRITRSLLSQYQSIGSESHAG